jgi:hypothetical protein
VERGLIDPGGPHRDRDDDLAASGFAPPVVRSFSYKNIGLAYYYRRRRVPLTAPKRRLIQYFRRTARDVRSTSHFEFDFVATPPPQLLGL